MLIFISGFSAKFFCALLSYQEHGEAIRIKLIVPLNNFYSTFFCMFFYLCFCFGSLTGVLPARFILATASLTSLL